MITATRFWTESAASPASGALCRMRRSGCCVRSSAEPISDLRKTRRVDAWWEIAIFVKRGQLCLSRHRATPVALKYFGLGVDWVELGWAEKFMMLV